MHNVENGRRHRRRRNWPEGLLALWKLLPDRREVGDIGSNVEFSQREMQLLDLLATLHRKKKKRNETINMSSSNEKPSKPRDLGTRVHSMMGMGRERV